MGPPSFHTSQYLFALILGLGTWQGQGKRWLEPSSWSAICQSSYLLRPHHAGKKKLACTPSSSYKHTAAHEKMSWTNDRFFWVGGGEKKPFTTTTTGGEIFSTSMVHPPHPVGKNPPGIWAYQKARCPLQTSNLAKSLFVFKNWGNTTVYLKKLAPSCFDVDMQLFRAGC